MAKSSRKSALSAGKQGGPNVNPNTPLQGNIQHVVVLMMENRSFNSPRPRGRGPIEAASVIFRLQERKLLSAPTRTATKLGLRVARAENRQPMAEHRA
jgi:hypothetical protein